MTILHRSIKCENIYEENESLLKVRIGTHFNDIKWRWKIYDWKELKPNSIHAIKSVLQHSHIGKF